MIPTSTNITVTVKSKAASAIGDVALLMLKGEAAPPSADLLDAAARESAAWLVSSKMAQGKAKEIVVHALANGKSEPRRIAVAGLGEPKDFTLEILRRAAAGVAKAMRKHKSTAYAIALPAIDGFSAAEIAETIASGILLASFNYREYKGTASKKKDDGDKSAEKAVKVELIAPASAASEAGKAVDRMSIICAAQNYARTIASRPGNDINPTSLAAEVQKMSREAGLRYSVMDEKKLASLNMGGILAVGAASIQTPPRMIILEHKPAKVSSKTGTLLVVGKTITFDTGGLSIKPAASMGRMIFDKCGGMAVMGFMLAAAQLKLPIHIVGILAAAENSISSKAYRPGDILRMHNGVTVEVTNTDAEGRLVLADALSWGIETYKPKAVVDLATLTGGVVVALGKTMAGALGNSDELVAELTAAGKSAGELIWQLPLGQDQREYIESTCADIVNSGGREGHPLQGGAFLSYFVPSDPIVPWVHLDIAGVADTEKDLPYYAAGATGWGVRTLVNWATARSNSK